jgi:fatty-acyl-CoA synthase
VGLYYTFISTRLKSAEAAYIIQDCDARVLVVSAETAPVILEAVRSLSNPPQIYCLDTCAGLALLADACNTFGDEPVQNTLEGSEMLYSSGTTGVPKGVKPQLTGLPLGSSCVIAGLLSRGFGVSSESVYLSPAPYYHAAPLKWGLGVLALGGTLVLMKKFRALETLAAIEHYRVTHSQWVPTMFSRLLALTDAEKSRYDLSSQRVAVHAAAPCPVPVKQAMISWWGPILVEYYSCTEAIGMTLVTCSEWLQRPGTVGRPLLGQLHIVNEDGTACAAGADGLVYFSDGVPFTYHKDAGKTRDAHNARGWATVGDVGHVDADGYLYLTDRKSNMIITGGVNVYPQEVENLLITHPLVFDAAVIGTAHPDFGEEVRAVVQLEPGVAASDATREALISYCREHLSPIKCPRVVDFRTELPREPNGKLLKRLLRDEYRALLE